MFYMVLIYIIGCLIIMNYRLFKKKEIYYSNYKNTLKALAEYDPKLKKYLESIRGDNNDIKDY